MPKRKIKVRNAVSDFLKRRRIVDKTIKVCYKKDKVGERKPCRIMPDVTKNDYKSKIIKA